VKICSACKIEKPLDQFWPRADSKDGYRGQCIACKKAWTLTPRGKIVKEKKNKRRRESAEYKAKQAEWEKGAAVREYRRRYKQQAHRKQRDREYQRSEKYLSKKRIACRNRYQNSIKLKIHGAVSCRIRGLIRKQNRSWPEILGYSAQQLMDHLEKQFRKGMTWKNFGIHGWHIEHIVPASSFNFSSLEDPEFKACWSLGNLRPEWAEVNWAKSDKRIFLL
jgi:hypothetical protein